MALPHYEDAQASPHDAPWLADQTLPYWKPSLKDALRHLGWNWLWFIPAAVVAVAMFWGIVDKRVWWMMLWGAKTVVVVVAGTVAAGFRAIRDEARARNDPFCIHCGYSLIGLPEGQKCPECGVPFMYSIINEYRRDPDRFVQRVRRQGIVPTAGPVLVVNRPVEKVEGDAGLPARRRSRDGT